MLQIAGTLGSGFVSLRDNRPEPPAVRAQKPFQCFAQLRREGLFEPSYFILVGMWCPEFTLEPKRNTETMWSRDLPL